MTTHPRPFSLVHTVQKELRGLMFGVSILLCARILHSAPPLDEDVPAPGRPCFLNAEAGTALAKRREEKIGILGRPDPLNPKILVIRVDFEDEVSVLSRAQAEAFFGRVHDYYLENSYGIFTPTFTVSALVHRLGQLGSYGSDCGGDIACGVPSLRQAAIAAELASGGRLMPYDQLMILHAGQGQETTGRAADIWSVYHPSRFTSDGRSFAGLTVVPETEANGIDALAVVCHEYGHQLGLPDLYDVSTRGGFSTVGSWDLMDYPYTAGPDGVRGANPPHLGAWSKSFLGFVTPARLALSGTTSYSTVQTAPQVGMMQIVGGDSGPEDEYFLIEYRHPDSGASFDRGIAGGGFLVWRVDERIASNSVRINNNDVNSPSLNGAGHRGVDLMEADLTEIYTGRVRGEAGDAFGNGDVFVSPWSDAFNGAPTGAVLSAMSGQAASGQFSYDIPAVSSTTFTSGASISIPTSFGHLSLEAPAGTLPLNGTVYLAALSESSLLLHGSASPVGLFQPTGVGALVTASGHAQPGAAVEIALGFDQHAVLGHMAADTMGELIVARYVPRSRTWLPLPSRVDAVNKTITASALHLSLFQIMRNAAPQNLDQVVIYPNPLRFAMSPYRMNFVNLVPDSQLAVFTLNGELIARMRADGNGLAYWNGQNNVGARVASGIYFVEITPENTTKREIRKVAVER